MAYPQYNITFQSAGTSTSKIKNVKGTLGPTHSDGSHAFVLDVNGTQVSVELSHQSEKDRTPKLVVTFK
jgi:hypothetical protein